MVRISEIIQKLYFLRNFIEIKATFEKQHFKNCKSDIQKLYLLKKLDENYSDIYLQESCNIEKESRLSAFSTVQVCMGEWRRRQL